MLQVGDTGAALDVTAKQVEKRLIELIARRIGDRKRWRAGWETESRSEAGAGRDRETATKTDDQVVRVSDQLPLGEVGVRSCGATIDRA